MSISQLRQRMVDDMTARHFGEKTQKDYIRCVKNLAAFIGRAIGHDLVYHESRRRSLGTN